MVIRRKSGRVVEESTVFVSAQAKPRRNKRKGTTTAQKQDENERDCVKRLARILNCNYAHGDLLLTPKYDERGLARLEAWAVTHREEGQTMEDAIIAAAEREGRNYMRRIERELEKLGVAFRYVLFTSDMDGETGEAVRIHHHLVIPRVGFELAAKKWGLGTVDYQILRDQDDYTPLAEYLCRQVRRRPNAKKYSVSRNMEKPVVNERWAKPGEELRPDRGARVTGRSEWDGRGAQYIRFVQKRRAVEQGSLDRSAGAKPKGHKVPLFQAQDGGKATRPRDVRSVTQKRRAPGSRRTGESVEFSDTAMGAGGRATTIANPEGGAPDGG